MWIVVVSVETVAAEYAARLRPPLACRQMTRRSRGIPCFQQC